MTDGPSASEIAANEKAWMKKLAGDWFDQERLSLVKHAVASYQRQEMSGEKAMQLLADLSALAKLEKRLGK